MNKAASALCLTPQWEKPLSASVKAVLLFSLSPRIALHRRDTRRVGACGSAAHIQTPIQSLPVPCQRRVLAHLYVPLSHLQGFQSAQRQLQITKKQDEHRIAALFWRPPYAINLFLASGVRTASIILRRVEISAKRGC